MADTTSHYTWLAPQNITRNTLVDEIKQFEASDLLQINTNKGLGICFRGSLDKLVHLQNLFDVHDIQANLARTSENLPGINDGIILRVASKDTDPVLSLLDEYILRHWQDVPEINDFQDLPIDEAINLAEQHAPKHEKDDQLTDTASIAENLLTPGKVIQNAGPEKNYFAMGPNGVTSWRYFKAQAMEGSLQGNPLPETTGWKLHVSAKNVIAQEKLAELAMEHHITEFKFAPEEWLPKFMNPESPQCGKTAVFYYSEKGTHGEAIDWEGFIQKAEKIVLEHGGPGPAVQRDRTIPGSEAVHYRNDRGANGEKYIPRVGITVYMLNNEIDESQSYNLAGEDDPFKGITLEPEQSKQRMPSKGVSAAAEERPLQTDSEEREAELETAELETVESKSAGLEAAEPVSKSSAKSGTEDKSASTKDGKTQGEGSEEENLTFETPETVIDDTPAPASSKEKESAKQKEEPYQEQDKPGFATRHQKKIVTGLGGAAVISAVGASTSWRERTQQRGNPEIRSRSTKKAAIFATVTAIAVGAAALTLGLAYGRSR